MKVFKETLLQRARRALGGPDERPPPNWPFPTWHGKLIRPEPENPPPPMPARRGPKEKP